jgi:hypothetical protein
MVKKEPLPGGTHVVERKTGRPGLVCGKTHHPDFIWVSFDDEWPTRDESLDPDNMPDFHLVPVSLFDVA